MRFLALIAVSGCGFSLEVGAADPDARTADAPPVDSIDGPPPAPPACAADPQLRMCFSFDDPALGPALPASLPSEVAGGQPAAVRGVGWFERAPGNGAALFSAQSSMRIPMDPTVTDIATIELEFRVDTMPPNRAGLVDSNTSSNISLFFHPQTAGYTFRCGIGPPTENFLVPVTTGTWHHVACVCDQGTLTLYVDGIAPLPARPNGCGGGAIIGDGLTIGSNNYGNAQQFDDQRDRRGPVVVHGAPAYVTSGSP